MADYTGLAASIFSEPEYRDQRDLIVAFYLILNSDMVGVCPVNSGIVAALCRTRKGKLVEIIGHLETCGKLTQSVTMNGADPTHIWWRSKLYHVLYKGHHSVTQLEGAITLIRKWGQSGVFGGSWADEFSQLYDNKYNIKIPPPTAGDTPSDKSESESEEESESDTLAAKPPVVSTTNPDHQKAIKYFCDLYLEKYQVKYLFAAGKDGTIVKRLLATFGFDFFCRLVDQIHVTNDEFIVNKGKVSLGVLSACANKLTQEIMGRNDLRLKFSEKERQALIDIAKGLGLQ